MYPRSRIAMLAAVLAGPGFGCGHVDDSCLYEGVCPPDGGTIADASKPTNDGQGESAAETGGMDGSPWDAPRPEGGDAGLTSGDSSVASVDGEPDHMDAHDVDGGSDQSSLPDADSGIRGASDPEPEAGLSVDADAAGGPVALANVALTGMLFVDPTAVYGTANGHATAIALPNGTTLATSATSIDTLWAISSSSVYGPSPTLDPLYSLDKSHMNAATVLDNGPIDGFTNASVSGSGVSLALWVWQFAPAAPGWLSIYLLSSGTPMAISNMSFTTVGCAALTGDGLGVVYALAPGSTDMPGPCTLFATSPAGGNTVQLASPSGAYASVLSTDQGAVYWYNGTDGKLYASSRSGNGYTGMVSSALPRAPVQLANDSVNLYWTDGAAGTVMAVPVRSAGASPTVLASGQSGAAGIAVDSTAIYWATSSALMRLTK